MSLTTVTANISGKARPAVLEGRDYLVFPTTIMVEGVHVGSTGAVLYEERDMKTFAPAWNHKPVVVNHPMQEGNFVSADDPAILEVHKVGFLMKNSVKDAKQNAEAWIEKDRLKKIHEGLFNAALEGKTIEVSTGLFSDNETNPGEWKGEHYDMVARNYRPDHLALLPDKVGACSCADGCGMFTAAQAVVNNLPCDKMKQVMADLLAGRQVSVNCGDCSCGNKPKEILMKEDLKKRVDSLVAAKAFEEADMEWLSSLEEKRLEKVIAGAEAEAQVKANAETAAKEAEAKAKAEAEAKKAEAIANQKKDEKKEEILQLNSVEDVVKHTSGRVRESFLQGIKAYEAERARLIDVITSNTANQFDKEELEDETLFNLDRLRKLAAAMTPVEPETPAFAGSPYLGAIGAPQTNASKKSEAPLAIPEMNYGK